MRVYVTIHNGKVLGVGSSPQLALSIPSKRFPNDEVFSNLTQIGEVQPDEDGNITWRFNSSMGGVYKVVEFEVDK